MVYKGVTKSIHTVNMERFAGLNFCEFKPNEVFCGKTFAVPYMFKILKQHHYTKLVYIHRKILQYFSKLRLAQQIFPRLQ